jgi:hypothetical protein
VPVGLPWDQAAPPARPGPGMSWDIRPRPAVGRKSRLYRSIE